MQIRLLNTSTSTILKIIHYVINDVINILRYVLYFCSPEIDDFGQRLDSVQFDIVREVLRELLW